MATMIQSRDRHTHSLSYTAIKKHQHILVSKRLHTLSIMPAR